VVQDAPVWGGGASGASGASGVAVCGLALLLAACSGSNRPAADARASSTSVGRTPTTRSSEEEEGRLPKLEVEAKPLAPGPVAHVVDIAGAIKATGLGCDTAAVSTGPRNNTPVQPAKEQGSCDIGDDGVAITLFADQDMLARGVSLLRQGACFVNATHPGNLTYVEGDNWIAFPQRTENARRIGEALHATLRTIRC